MGHWHVLAWNVSVDPLGLLQWAKLRRWSRTKDHSAWMGREGWDVNRNDLRMRSYGTVAGKFMKRVQVEVSSVGESGLEGVGIMAIQLQDLLAKVCALNMDRDLPSMR
jgi:hypothetical protein